MSYDFSDHMIMNMVMIEHQPTEVRMLGDLMEPGIRGPEDYIWGSAPRCKTCQESWPCNSITQLRDWEKERQKAHYVQMAEGGYRGEVEPW